MVKIHWIICWKSYHNEISNEERLKGYMDIKINYYCKVGSLSEYKIIMKNHYISPKGSIIKEQVLSADYHKKISSGLTPKSAKIIYTWDKVKYTSNNWIMNK